MPIFDLKCPDCSNVQEVIVLGSNRLEEMEVICNECGCDEMEKMVTSAAIKLDSSFPGEAIRSDNNRIRRENK